VFYIYSQLQLLCLASAVHRGRLEVVGELHVLRTVRRVEHVVLGDESRAELQDTARVTDAGDHGAGVAAGKGNFCRGKGMARRRAARHYAGGEGVALGRDRTRRRRGGDEGRRQGGGRLHVAMGWSGDAGRVKSKEG
jgi:hypothetical protein